MSEEKNSPKKLKFKYVVTAFSIFFLGALAYASVRFILVKQHTTHYHANFALYINGERDEFKSFTFYEEVAACNGDHSMNPKSRAHMHNNKNDLVHVHDDAVTWAHFFSNIGYTLADGLLIKQSAYYIENKDSKFTYLLNGEKVNSIADKVINSGDALLISYGNDKYESVKNRYDKISKDAKSYNEQTDPSTCSGADSESIKERLTRTLFK